MVGRCHEDRLEAFLSSQKPEASRHTHPMKLVKVPSRRRLWQTEKSGEQ